jgi:3-hydroxyisobutyrate dehydrogenase
MAGTARFSRVVSFRDGNDADLFTGRGTEMIAFYGMGLLGSNFVRALRDRGETVHVWSRTIAHARALQDVGAVAFDDPAEAARGAARVHVTVTDDEAVDDVLERARDGFGDGTVIVDHTTTSAAGAAERVKRWDGRGIGFQHAPVFMGPQNARDATGWMLASGDRARFDALEPELAKMTGTVVYLGPRPERAAAFKLMGNLFLEAMTAGVIDMLKLAKAMDVEARDAAALFDWFNPGATLPARVARVLEADFEHPSWGLDMARKDARLMMEAAGRGDVALTVIPAVAREMDRWIESGHGQHDWTVMARDALGG